MAGADSEQERRSGLLLHPTSLPGPYGVGDLGPGLEAESRLLDRLPPDCVFAGDSRWNQIASPDGAAYAWDADSTYIQEPPFFDAFSPTPRDITEIHGARPLGIFGDSVTTDHISPAGSFKPTTPARTALPGIPHTTELASSWAST